MKRNDVGGKPQDRRFSSASRRPLNAATPRPCSATGGADSSECKEVGHGRDVSAHKKSKKCFGSSFHSVAGERRPETTAAVVVDDVGLLSSGRSLQGQRVDDCDVSGSYIAVVPLIQRRDRIQDANVLIRSHGLNPPRKQENKSKNRFEEVGGDFERVGGTATSSGRNMDEVGVDFWRVGGTATSSGRNMDDGGGDAEDGHVTTTTCASLYELAATLPSVEDTKRTTTTVEDEDCPYTRGDNNVGGNTHVAPSGGGRPPHDWGSLPSEALLQIFSHLTIRNLGRVAQTCSHWRCVSQHPLLWQRIEFNMSHNKCDETTPPTPTGLVDHVLRHHARHLKFVVFRTDSSVESARTACRILARLVNCSLRTLSLVSSARPVFLDVDQDSFVSALTVVLDRSDALASLAIDHTPVDDPSLEALASSRSSRTLRLLGMKSCPRVSPQGVLALADHCRCLRELSLSFSLLSDALLIALSTGRRVRLETLRVDVHTDGGRRLPDISPASWASLVAHSPGVDLVVYAFATGDDCLDRLFTSYVPVTHLFFGDHAPKRILGRLGRFCPRLKELVVGADGNSFLDEELQGIARGCSSLECLGLAECEVTCSGFVEVVRLCGGRLKQLFVTEECLVEDRDCDLVQMCKTVSELIGRDWCPEFVPCW